MRFLLVLLVVICVAVAVVALAQSRRSGQIDRRLSQHRITDAHRDADAWPSPGEGSPRRGDGEPVPGSEADRRRHGKP